MEATEALAQLGGAATHGALIALTTRRGLRTAVARGEVRRVAHDRYVLAAVGEAQRMAERFGAHLSHLSAALEHGWEVRSAPADPQLIVPSGTDLPRLGRARVRVYDARPHELGAWTTRPVTTVLLCARDLDHAEGLAVADSALRHGDVTADELAAAARGWADHVQDLVAQATGQAANPFESVLRSVLLRGGFDLVPQFEIRVGGGVFRPDLVDPVRGVIVEAESWTFHSDREAFERDCRRYTLLTADGWRVLRFTYEQVMHRPDHVLRCMAAVYDHEPFDTPGDAPGRRRVVGRVA